MQVAQDVDAPDGPDRWSTRFGSLYSVATWRQTAGTPRAPLLAFNLIAGDRGILGRARPDDAAAMARSAEALLARNPSAAEPAELTRAAAAVVLERIAAWRRHDVGRAKDPAPRIVAAAGGFDADGFDAEGGEGTELSMTENLRKDFPQVRPSSARYVFNITRRLGVAGLAQLGAPMDAVFALGAARVAAQDALGWLPGISFTPRERLEVIGIVQEWGERAGTNPFATNGHGGRHGTLMERITARVVETSACVEMAAQLPGGARAPGFAQWEDALETHAYVLMSAAHPGLEELPFHRARDISSAAARLAAHAIAHPDCALPDLPEGWVGRPRELLKSVTSMLVGDIARRQSPITAFRMRPASPAPARAARVPAAPPPRNAPAAPKMVWAGVTRRR